ncbi:UNVERIFIED_ORG: phenylpropionate dioxygenase-like ring-hydroxylating dioxygenase large terminal subunit [Pseudomonas putida]|jgi:phenylpropionate dioxygenase-like ring-hydroxylating dioxygenase large terminal subunit|nr:phenylpropionate dioxygenase-like ring-hydroxylating dioxygenase large terminal subunit [Pseudomonas putida]
MLTAEQNRLLTDVSPGTPLHRYWKRQWIPALRSEALEPGGTPQRVELLCEKYVAFRADDGHVGFLHEACPHRGVSLALGRNEGNRLTCIFHGWSFDTQGNCTKMPTEKDQAFCKKVKGQEFKVREGGGIVWVYLGEGEAPAFTDYAFTYFDRKHTRPRASYNEANWLQNVETLMDSAHIGLLHHDTTANPELPRAGLQLVTGNDTPKYTLESKPYGLRSYSLRTTGQAQDYLRVTEFVAPATAFIGTTEQEAGFLIIVVPVNNTRSLQWYVYWDSRQPIDENLPDFALLGTDESDDNFAASRQGLPNYGQDREAMRAGRSWTGVPGVIFEDYAVAESIPIVDRTREFLGSGDLAIVRLRRELMERIRQSEANEDSIQAQASDYRSLRALADMIPVGTVIQDYTEQKRQERRMTYL